MAFAGEIQKKPARAGAASKQLLLRITGKVEKKHLQFGVEDLSAAKRNCSIGKAFQS